MSAKFFVSFSQWNCCTTSKRNHNRRNLIKFTFWNALYSHKTFFFIFIKLHHGPAVLLWGEFHLRFHRDSAGEKRFLKFIYLVSSLTIFISIFESDLILQLYNWNQGVLCSPSRVSKNILNFRFKINSLFIKTSLKYGDWVTGHPGCWINNFKIETFLL